jgi:reduced coenzyme F420:NADP oxidoreductase (EC 1.6.99.-)
VTTISLSRRQPGCSATRTASLPSADAGSVTAIVADAAPEGISVVGAFHNLAAGRLSDLDSDLGIDTLVIAEDSDAKATVSGLAEDITGLRALDAGGLANAAEIESMTPLLINVAMNNDGLHDWAFASIDTG